MRRLRASNGSHGSHMGGWSQGLTPQQTSGVSRVCLLKPPVFLRGAPPQKQGREDSGVRKLPVKTTRKNRYMAGFKSNLFRFVFVICWPLTGEVRCLPCLLHHRRTQVGPQNQQGHAGRLLQPGSLSTEVYLADSLNQNPVVDQSTPG